MTKTSLRRLYSWLVTPLILFAFIAVSPSGSGMQEDESEPGLSLLQTRGLVARYKEAKHWSLKSIVLLALGERWHPEGAEIVAAALTQKDRHLRAYALATLQATDPEHLHSVATSELVEALVSKGLKEKDEFFREEVIRVLETIFPDAGVEKKSKWKRYWKSQKAEYVPAEWHGPTAPVEVDRRSSAATVIQRAMDLYESGLEVVICIDSTGSMQSTIDAARDAVSDIVSILQGVSPNFRLGLVHYKDVGDLGKLPAKVLEPLSDEPEDIEKRLGRLVAGGGGDVPEAVEFGLQVALSPEMNWQRTTNKLVVLIGDAPPHNGEPQRTAVKLVKDALEKPFGVDPTDITPVKRTGRSSTNKVVRGFVTAAIAVGSDSIATSTKATFEEIAKAGGGAYASLLTGDGSGDASREIARHIMRQSFGTQWKKQMDQFVNIYFEYRERGYFE